MLLRKLKLLLKNQRGEIATVLTLISVGLMLVGIVVGNAAVQQTTRTQSKASWDCHICSGNTCRYIENQGGGDCNAIAGAQEGGCARDSCGPSTVTTTPPSSPTPLPPNTPTPSARPSGSTSPTPGPSARPSGSVSSTPAPSGQPSATPPAGDCEALKKQGAAVDCNMVTPMPSGCTPGWVKYSCEVFSDGKPAKITCPSDSRLLVAYPFVCDTSGKFFYNANTYGECTPACPNPAANLPTPTPYPGCNGMADGAMADNGKCQYLTCGQVGNAAHWLKTIYGCKDGKAYPAVGGDTGWTCTLKPGYSTTTKDCDIPSADKITPTETQETRTSPTPKASPTSSVNNASCTLSSGNTNFTQKCANCILGKRNEWITSKKISNTIPAPGPIRLRDNIPDSCGNEKVIEYWCSGSDGKSGSVADCKKSVDECNQQKENGTPLCNVKPTSGPTPTGGPSPTATAAKCSDIKRLKPLTSECATCIVNEDMLKTYTDRGLQSCSLTDRVSDWCAINRSTCKTLIDSRTSCNSTCPRDISLFPQSYSNEGYESFIDGVKKGLYNAIDASNYVANASRVPGLQRQFCDPFAGQCDFYYQQLLNNQTGDNGVYDMIIAQYGNNAVDSNGKINLSMVADPALKALAQTYNSRIYTASACSPTACSQYATANLYGLTTAACTSMCTAQVTTETQCNAACVAQGITSANCQTACRLLFPPAVVGGGGNAGGGVKADRTLPGEDTRNPNNEAAQFNNGVYDKVKDIPGIFKDDGQIDTTKITDKKLLNEANTYNNNIKEGKVKIDGMVGAPNSSFVPGVNQPPIKSGNGQNTAPIGIPGQSGYIPGPAVDCVGGKCYDINGQVTKPGPVGIPGQPGYVPGPAVDCIGNQCYDVNGQVTKSGPVGIPGQEGYVPGPAVDCIGNQCYDVNGQITNPGPVGIPGQPGYVPGPVVDCSGGECYDINGQPTNPGNGGIDTDGDGIPDTGIDSDGDGIPDPVNQAPPGQTAPGTAAEGEEGGIVPTALSTIKSFWYTLVSKITNK